MAADVVGEEFVTIVPVGEGRPNVVTREAANLDPTFVTVLTVGAATGAAEVTVHRSRGARLGLGLKFEGGSAAAEKVRRLLVQSCAEDSPAANAVSPWGKLIPGDEILAIDGVSVSELTRIDCVRRLKDSDEALKLLVRHFENDSKTEVSGTNGTMPEKQVSDISRPMTLPPPVPPRKLGKKNSFKEKHLYQTLGENDIMDKEMNGQHNGLSTLTKLSRKSSFDSHILRQNKESISCFKKGSPEEVRRLVRRLSDGKAMPPEAEVYVDLLSSEWERCLVIGDTESDDTGSSISTVVDRLGSMASSVENSIPSTPIMQPKTIDIQKVLNCIENIDSDILKDMTSNRFMEKQKNICNETKHFEHSRDGYNNQENITQALISDSVNCTAKKLQQDDNNNHQNIPDNERNKISDKTEIKTEVVGEKPKPMPRNAKIERSASEKKPRPIPVPPTPATPVPDTLLTPTKKNCIETWLQRSEAEMNNKSVEKFEESTLPEALPRLIDFVPKSQYKECSETTHIVRPTAPPPPPPAEVREDGSGASLDTIGELDESIDVTDNLKPILAETTPSDRKSFDRSYWEDRVNKSDAEDKSLSNDESLPTCPRQPPDGVETPFDAVEKTHEFPARLPPRLPVGWPNSTRPRYSYISRTQDARSEASVKDKIAMFSNDVTDSSDHLDKYGTLPSRNALTARKSTITYTTNFSEGSLDRRLTKSQDNLDEVPRSFKRHSERPEVLGALENTGSTTNLDTVKNRSLNVDTKPLFYGSTTALSSPIPSTPPIICHARSISDDNGKKNIGKHKSNLEYLIEQRKKSMSKLRGLVIPEVQGPIIDLPAIKLQDSIAKSFIMNSSCNDVIKKEKKENKTTSTKLLNFNEPKWNTSLMTNNLPKYSPAFKRKSLQVYTPSSLSKETTPELKKDFGINITNKPIESYKRLQETKHNILNRSPITPLESKYSYTNSEKISSREYKTDLRDIRDYKNVEIKICTITDVVDSDNDSAMSSTQSSYRSSASSPMHHIDTMESDNSRISPRISHYTSYKLTKTDIPTKSSTLEKNCEEYMKLGVCRSMSSDTNVSLSSSAGSAATSGSQASCSSLESSVADSDKKNVLKSYNIDTINRRNILASAKCRSGRDAKVKSPVVDTKFVHESLDKCPSPTPKSSDRLSTLTSSVSAITNKGETRRRNKVYADTDSDSDSDNNIRQRKSEYKNTRLKRNLSSSNKSKPTESSLETSKIETDASRAISEKIIKEIKKVGLDNFTSVTKPINLADKNNVEIKTVVSKINNKPEKQSIVELSSRQKENGVIDKKSVGNSLKDLNKKDLPHDKPVKNAIWDKKVETHLVRLQRGVASGVGLILAGGIDCEAKDVTVHRVLSDSIAAKAGLKRGAKVRSINGCSMNGLTHAQSVKILKEQRAEVIIEIEDDREELSNGKRCGSQNVESTMRDKTSNIETKSSRSDTGGSKVVTVVVEKAGGGAGLGFGLDGGRDSPYGDRPLTVKKLFAGGAAAQCGKILVGAVLLSAGGQSMEKFTRTQAWAALKALPAGPVTLVLENP